MDIRKLRPVAAAALLTLALGCTDNSESSDDGDLGDVLRHEFESAMERTTSDFEREVIERALDNGGISEEDYDEAFSRFHDCADNVDLDEQYTKQPNGLYEISNEIRFESEEEFDEFNKLSFECAEGTVLVLGELYELQVNNPEVIEPDQLVVDCLTELGAVEPEYTADEFRQDLEDGVQDNYVSAPWDPYDDDVNECLRLGGITIVGDPG